jgi:hypothetical protein
MDPEISDDKLYGELGKAWLHYISWREKIFAGYLTVLAALAYAFSRDASPSVRSAVFAFAILISVVFRILDIRTTGYVNLCQKAGRSLTADKGLYAEIDKNRFSAWSVATYGFAINMLVASVIGASAVGLVISVLKWRHSDYAVSWYWSVFAVAGAILVLIIAECCTSRIWKREKDENKTPKPEHPTEGVAATPREQGPTQRPEWKKIARKWWGPAVTYLLASVLNLSQKRSPIAVDILLTICTLWTLVVVNALDWWTNASGWKRFWRALLPLVVLIPVQWSAIVFFRPSTPPKSYPWLATNYWLPGDNKSISAVRLSVQVRDEPPSPDALKGAASLSALYNLDVRISMPVAVTSDGGWYSCNVARLSVPEWNNMLSSQKLLATVPLTADTTVLEVEASSRNANWHGAVAIHRNGDHLDWEEYLSGWVQSDQRKDAVVVGQIRKDGKIKRTDQPPFIVTSEFLIAAGVPVRQRVDAAKTICPTMQ